MPGIDEVAAKEADLLNKTRILIIDDEEDICMFSKSALEKTGRYEVLFSVKAKEGIDLAKSNKPDLILLDVRMPGMDGAEVAKCLYEDEATKAIPVVFLSAVAVPAAFLLSMIRDIKQRAGHEGYYFIQKPVASNELASRVDSILSGK